MWTQIVSHAGLISILERPNLILTKKLCSHYNSDITINKNFIPLKIKNMPDLLIESYQIKILPKNTFRLIKTNPRKRNKIRLFEAEFGEKFPILDFVYVDYSEDTLFFCALHDEVDSSLFTAFGKKPDSKIFQFSPSLSNVLCINPQKNFPDTWLSSSVAGATLIDMHLSLSSRGVIFASQFKHKLNLTEARMLHVDHFQTMVSFDFGKTWSVLRLRNDCKMDEKEPRLYLDLSFSRLFFDKPFLGILESSHIPGLIVSTGHLMYAHDTETYPGVFGSQNGGLTWTKLFDERFLIAMSTDGEFLAGIRQCLDGPTQQIFISYDFGHSWTSRRIFRRDACVHEILTSPFDVLAMLSSRPVEDVWIISVVDFDRSASSVHKCQRKDIQLYPLGSGRQFCVHGQKIMHYRRNPDVQCKILNYEHKFLNFSCDCTEKDFICTNESCRFMDREELRINLTQAKSNKEIPIIASRFGFKLEPWNECVFSRNPFHKRSSFYLPKCQTKVKKSSNIEEFPSRATGSISPLLGALFYAISSLALFCIRL